MTASPIAWPRTGPISTQPLDGMRAAVLVQGPLKSAEQMAKTCRQNLLGAVYTLTAAAPRGGALIAALDAHEVATGTRTDTLVDAGRYAGKRRHFASQGLTPDWVQRQHRMGLQWALTDSGYVADGDIAGLRHVLESASREPGKVIAVLPLDVTWVGKRAHELRQEIERAGVPVGLVLQHSGDPLGARANVTGLMHVLESQVPVVLLRCDLSAVGAVAFGAAHGAIGTSSSYRHLYPADASGGGGFASKTYSALVPRLWSYRSDRLIDDAIRSSSGPIWWCPCMVCDDRRLDWLTTQDEAFAHSLSALAPLTERVLAAGAGARDRQRSWIENCKTAQFEHLDLEGQTGDRWEPPKFQNAWVSATSPTLTS